MHTKIRPIKFTADRGSAELPIKIFKVKAMFVTGSDKACTEQKVEYNRGEWARLKEGIVRHT